MGEEKIKITKLEDTLKMRPWPAVPPPPKEEVEKIHEKFRGEAGREYGKFLEETLHWKDIFHKPEALMGLRVIDAGIWRIANAYCSSIFGEFGAEVIKLEPPGGDPLRKLTPFGREEYMLKDSETGEPCGLEFINEMRNKYSVTLNLEDPRGREILKKMIPQVDVFIENYPPGYFDELGIGYRQLSKINPRLVYCWIGEHGQWGPMKDKTSKFGQWLLDPAGQVVCEFVHSTGFPPDLLPRGSGGDPTRSGTWIADYIAGEHAFVGCMAALYYRDEVSGRGQFVEATSAEAYMEVNDFNVSWYGFDGSIKPRTGGWDPCLNQYAWNPCKDGFMMIGGQTDRLWYRIGMTIERDKPEYGRFIHEDPLLKEMAARNALEALIKTYTLTAWWLREQTRDQVEAKLMEYEVAAGPLLYPDEVAEYPHFKYRRFINTVEDEHYGTILHVTPPHYYHHRTPARVKWLGRPLGHDNYLIYGKLLGMGASEVDKLKAEKVI